MSNKCSRCGGDDATKYETVEDYTGTGTSRGDPICDQCESEQTTRSFVKVGLALLVIIIIVAILELS